MQNYDSPYHKFMDLYPQIEDSDIIIVDFHAEATGEKMAFARAVDGMVSAVIGTHTHVQTNDAQIFPEGTAYITDAGLTGAIDSILGMKADKMIQKMKDSLPLRYDVGTGKVKMEAAVIKTNVNNSNVKEILEIKRKEK